MAYAYCSESKLAKFAQYKHSRISGRELRRDAYLGRFLDMGRELEGH